MAAAVDGEVFGVEGFFAEEDGARVVADVGVGEKYSLELEMGEGASGLFELGWGIDEPEALGFFVDNGEASGGARVDGWVCAVEAGASGLGESAILGYTEEAGLHGEVSLLVGSG